MRTTPLPSVNINTSSCLEGREHRQRHPQQACSVHGCRLCVSFACHYLKMYVDFIAILMIFIPTCSCLYRCSWCFYRYSSSSRSAAGPPHVKLRSDSSRFFAMAASVKAHINQSVSHTSSECDRPFFRVTLSFVSRDR